MITSRRTLQADRGDRARLWTQLIERIERYLEAVDALPVTPVLDPRQIRSLLASVDFAVPADPGVALDFAADGLTRFQTHTPHARYFGLFNPCPTTMGIVADALVAAFNPQLAAWSHSPFAAEVERRLIRDFGERFGYERDKIDGTFASGGMEANHTAVLTALASAFPSFGSAGLRGLRGQPVLYISREAHHSFHKAALMCGLGLDSVRAIAVDDSLRVKPAALAEAIERDRSAGLSPFLVVATAGTTNAGVIDPLAAVAEIAARESVWYHVDAAWGGGAALVAELRPLLNGIQTSDSITFDAHKWLSVPMGAGLYITRHPDILGRTFRVPTAYMPREAAHLDVADPHLHSMQWSRRFIGLKVFLSLMVAGWQGYEQAIRHQTSMGELLRERLLARGWDILNDTALPVVCFTRSGATAQRLHEIAMAVVRSGEAWISTTTLDGTRPALRACITNFRTEAGDVEALCACLERAHGSTEPVRAGS